MIRSKSEASWPNAAVVLLTAARATELFLKGMIIAKTPDADVQSQNIDLLARTFRLLYPEQELAWDIPLSPSS